MPKAKVANIKRPFDEAINFYKQKVNIPTRRWDDIWEGAHARAFMVAGAMKAGLLNDFRKALDRSIRGGSYKDFQKDFDTIVARHGWEYNGGRGWRTGVIYRTNLRAAYQAGRYKQMTDPDVLKSRPYMRYVHGDSQRPRPEHLAWHNLVLPSDDPFWQTHYPSNGWGCSCTVETLSRRQLKRMGKTGPDKAPQIKQVKHTNKSTGKTHLTPEGIDPGFAYNVGQAAYGRPIAQAVISAHAGGKWATQGGKGPVDYGRGAVPADKPVAKLGKAARSEKELDGLYHQAIGGESVQLRDKAGDFITLDAALLPHLKASRIDGRERYFPLVKEVVEDPFEIWASFAKNELTGQYGLRRNYVKLFDMGGRAKDNRIVALVAEAVDGVWTGLTVFRGKKDALKNLRKGVLVYGRK